MKSLLFVLFPAVCFGQASFKRLETVLKLNATSLVDVFSFPTLQLSVERFLAKNVSLSGEVGYQLYRGRRADTAFSESNGLKADVEARLYGAPTAAGIGTGSTGRPYGGLRFFYRQNDYDVAIPYQKATDTMQYNDNLAVRKKVWGVNAVVGYQATFRKRFILDTYGGFGLMNRRVENSHREIDASTDVISGTDLVPAFRAMDLSDSNGWTVSATLGLRLGIGL